MSTLISIVVLVGAMGGSTVDEGVTPLKSIDTAAGTSVGLGKGAGIGVGTGGGARLGTGAIADVDEDVDGVRVAAPADSGVSVAPLVEAPPPVPDEPASAGPPSRSSSLSNVLEDFDEEPLGAVAASNVFHLGFNFCALFA